MLVSLLAKAVALPVAFTIGMSGGSHLPVEIDHRAPVITAVSRDRRNTWSV
ncbi:hypothetical protein [Streptomyces yanii]|uniref:Uncharacterized protein n=1 Tax=Streptomyces yanii TaxID=78510 RepID=A0ABV5RJ23_9ACTN